MVIDIAGNILRTMKKSIGSDTILTKELIDNIDVILDATHNDLLISDGDGKVIAINSTFEKMYGLKKEETLGKTVFQLEDEGFINPSIVALVLKEKRRISIQQKNYEGRDFLVTASPVFDDEGKIAFVFSYSRDITEILELQSQLKQFSEELDRLRGAESEEKIISVSKASKDACTRMRTIAAYDASVILTGASGVGKTLYARHIHKLSDRRDGPFIEVNCAAIPETLMESELFGYEKGAFTGASEKGKAGFIELADKGTLFLDEISEMSLPLQAKLLSVIQDKTVTRVGGVKPKKVDFRLITATNQDISKAVAEGKFREDLFYRLNVLNLNVLPLKERKEDIIPLCEHFLEAFNKRYGKHKEFDAKALQSLLNYAWPGNVRELSNVVERTAMMTESDVISTIDFSSRVEAADSPGDDFFEVIDLNQRMEETEREIFVRAWKKYGSSTKVAKALSISQPTAYRKLKKHIDNYSE